MAAQFSCAMMRCLCLMFVLFSFIDGKFITPLEKCKLGVVQTVVWEPETRDETSDAKGDKGSVVELLQQLKAMDWECPVKVKGKTLATTLPVRKWSSLSYLKGKCQSTSVSVDIQQDSPIFTYFDENTAYGKDDNIKPLSYSQDISSSTFLSMLSDGPYSTMTKNANNELVSSQLVDSIMSSESSSSSLTFVRYGGKIKKSPCSRLARDIDAYVSLKKDKNHGEEQVENSLFIGSIGVASSFHFDLFDNIYSVVVGSKKLTLVPPSIASLFTLNPHPGAHPNARQAQHFVNHSQQENHVIEVTVSNGDSITVGEGEGSDELKWLSKVEVDLNAGEAIYIPAGWFHEVFSDYTSPAKLNYTASIAITSNVVELTEFKQWLVGDGALKLPPGEWKVRRLGSFLSVYIPTLLKLLHEYEIKHPDFITDSKTSSQYPAAWALQHLVHHSYSPKVRQQLDIKREKFPCELLDTLSAEDRNRAVELANENANRFIQKFRLKLIRLFIQPYLETVLSKFGNKLTNGLNFAECCLLQPQI